MDERSARATLVTAYIVFLVYVGVLAWFVYRRLFPPVRALAPVFRLVPAAPDAPAEEAPPAPEPTDRPKKKGH